MSLRALVLLGLALLMAGCAGNVKPLVPETAADLRASKVALAYIYPEKQLNYNELVYKVLWNENHSNTVSFKGLWDIDRDLSRRYLENFQHLGMDIVSAQEILAPAPYQHLAEALADYKAQPDAPPFALNPALQQALRDQGVKYLILIRQGPLVLQAFTAFKNVSVRAMNSVRVYDTHASAPSYDGSAYMWLKYDIQESPRELENNRLAPLKQLMADGVDAQFREDQLPKAMGLVAQ